MQYTRTAGDARGEMSGTPARCVDPRRVGSGCLQGGDRWSAGARRSRRTSRSRHSRSRSLTPAVAASGLPNVWSIGDAHPDVLDDGVEAGRGTSRTRLDPPSQKAVRNYLKPAVLHFSATLKNAPTASARNVIPSDSKRRHVMFPTLPPRPEELRMWSLRGVMSFVVFMLVLTGCSAPAGGGFDPDDRPLVEIAAALRDGRTSSSDLVHHYLRRIEQYDDQGPEIQAVISLDPDALARARDRDEHRPPDAGPLYGIPFVVKDNIDVAGLPTTGGSAALEGNVATRNATAVQRLLDGGAIVLGKTNMSELATSYGRYEYSSAGGQTHPAFRDHCRSCSTGASRRRSLIRRIRSSRSGSRGIEPLSPVREPSAAPVPRACCSRTCPLCNGVWRRSSRRSAWTRWCSPPRPARPTFGSTRAMTATGARSRAPSCRPVWPARAASHR
ncbi:hypothetical protein CFP66_01090 [Pseudonocardia sp. MH-G8]|nr:hypothetical protein CFP66_01090 [Pseudonocardia sp. MH-G8]